MTGVDFSGLRVGVIGTGSSAIQAIPVIAEQAAQLTVFQRTPNYSIPSRNGPMQPDYAESWKSDYPALRLQARVQRTGILNSLNNQSALEVPADERRRIFEERWAQGGTSFMAAFNDLIFEQRANDAAAEFVREKIREIVHDRATADLLAPKDYPDRHQAHLRRYELFRDLQPAERAAGRCARARRLPRSRRTACRSATPCTRWTPSCLPPDSTR